MCSSFTFSGAIKVYRPHFTCSPRSAPLTPSSQSVKVTYGKLEVLPLRHRRKQTPKQLQQGVLIDVPLRSVVDIVLHPASLHIWRCRPTGHNTALRRSRMEPPRRIEGRVSGSRMSNGPVATRLNHASRARRPLYPGARLDNKEINTPAQRARIGYSSQQACEERR
jgi:hypothetical protein